jgi:HEAT repeat protein
MAKLSPYQEMAISTLCQALLNDEDTGVRCRVAKALGEIGSDTAIPTLLQAMNDANPEVRQQVV